jgi:two-component system nitrogen regulation response regulator GlnG
MPKILIVDDEESICWGLAKLCEDIGYESVACSSAEAGLGKTANLTFDAIVLDVNLPGINGIDAIEKFRQFSAAPIIVMTAFGDLQTAILAIQQGAFEYLVKPFDLNVVRSTLEQAIATAQIRSDSEGQSDSESGNKFSLIGSSPLMQEVFKQIAMTTSSDSPVLITGQSGTGKELTARSIHRFGPRSEGPFVPVNIASLNPGLAESELFGHVKGAFTGAETDRTGLIQQASGGTLFLDEVAEIPIALQVKLLRVLDQQEVTPVGSGTPVKTDFRLVSATNQDLLSQINHGEFRHDLFYRLRTFEIRLPSLSQRSEDIPELVRHFLRGDATRDLVVTDDFIARLKSMPWEGNVRQLRSVVERAAAFARTGGVLTREHVEPAQSVSADSNSSTGSLSEIVEQWLEENWNNSSIENLYETFVAMVDRELLPKAFSLSDGQYSAAARRLGIHRTTLKRKLDEIASLGDHE